MSSFYPYAAVLLSCGVTAQVAVETDPPPPHVAVLAVVTFSQPLLVRAQEYRWRPLHTPASLATGPRSPPPFLLQRRRARPYVPVQEVVMVPPPSHVAVQEEVAMVALVPPSHIPVQEEVKEVVMSPPPHVPVQEVAMAPLPSHVPIQEVAMRLPPFHVAVQEEVAMVAMVALPPPSHVAVQEEVTLTLPSHVPVQEEVVMPLLPPSHYPVQEVATVTQPSHVPVQEYQRRPIRGRPTPLSRW
ncbi:synaptic defective enhancer 1-like [Syngnathoides biaculeatus]|uniref:synaptic defective enhancer 1-like n=1 Tax=Syngnathoides biaculeatus TaxID=300417 RepID=UPI002ADD8EAF|nr:synaptic defective enhancer 1-like [Syngnathoides biaculeatus]